VVELGVHALVAMFSAAAGRMLMIGSSAAIRMASAAILASGTVAVQSIYWSVLPRDVVPGTRGTLAAFWIVITLALLAMVHRGRRA
jgi:hypothetical protein